ncbi:hypothetical protein D3C77_623780 [compost metagenome]
MQGMPDISGKQTHQKMTQGRLAMLIAECLQHQLPKHRLHVELADRLPQGVILQFLSFGQRRKNSREHCKQFSLLNLGQHCEDLQI